MSLKFFGRGSGFSNNHTSACFSIEKKELVILDCPVSAFIKLQETNLSDYEKIYVLITHTHGDHIGGLGLFVQYAYFTLKKPIVIVAPSKAVADDISTIFSIEGNEPSWCEIVTVTDVKEKEWFRDCILTKHAPQLDGKCFGYNLYVNGKNVVYTGDTSTLEPFLPYLIDDSELYVDTSVHYGMIHLKLEDSLNDFIEFTQRGIQVYIMHLDDVAAAEIIIADIPNIEVVRVD